MKYFLVLLLLALPAVSWAEGGCPTGQYPQEGQGWRSCVPIPGQVSGQGSEAPAQWSERWQALATDRAKAILGTSKDLSSMREAEATAVNNCKSKGGTDCHIAISYANGCVSMAVGTKVLTTGYGISKQEAAKAAISECAKEGDDTCANYFSQCSYAARIQ